jgi:Tfp pilus assembly PilM family ATPase
MWIEIKTTDEQTNGGAAAFFADLKNLYNGLFATSSEALLQRDGRNIYCRTRDLGTYETRENAERIRDLSGDIRQHMQKRGHDVQVQILPYEPFYSYAI